MEIDRRAIHPLFAGSLKTQVIPPVNDPPILSKPIAPRNRTESLLDNRWAVLAAIFFALMFLGLPLLWRCPNFSKTEKVVWTIIVLIYSTIIIWGFIAIMTWSYSRIAETLSI